MPIDFQDLTKIKQSSATSWGLLPPRHDEPNFDETFLRNLSTERHGLEKTDRLRTNNLSRPLAASHSAADFHHSDPNLHLSHLDGSAQIGDPTRPRRLRRQSLIKLDEESKRTEETLKKFNEVFPTDVNASVIPQIQLEQPGEEDTNEEQQAEQVTSLLPLRKQSQNTKKESVDPDKEGKASLDLSKKRVLEPIEKGSLTAKTKRRNSVNTTKAKRRSSQSVSAIKRRKSTLTTEDLSGSRRTGKGSLSVTKALQYLADEKETNEVTDDQTTPRKASNPQQSMGNLDVQDARDKIVKRLVSNDSLAKSQPQHGSVTPRDMRILSPIREQRTELSLTSQPVPQMVPRFPSNIEGSTSSTKVSKMKKTEEGKDEKPVFDSYRYNPDGSIRTMHILPDLSGSLEEAKKARYIRHLDKQWYDKELKVNEIFEES